MRKCQTAPHKEGLFIMKKFLLIFGILVCMLALGANTAYARTVRLGDAIRNAAEELSAGMGQDTRVAVVSMRADSARMSDHLIDEMIMAVVNTQRLLVVNRAQLDIIAAELHLGLDGWIDDATAQSIGRLAGVQIIFMGVFEPVGNIYRLRVQAVEVETAIIRRIFSVDIRNDAVVSALMGSAGRETQRWAHWEPRMHRDPDQPRVNWVSFEVAYITKGGWFGPSFGIRYERNVNRFISVGGIAIYRIEVDFVGLVTTRFFPSGFPFYFEAGLGYASIQTMSDDDADNRGMALSLGAGLRLGGRRSGFFANPFASLILVVPEDGVRFRGGIGAGWAW